MSRRFNTSRIRQNYPYDVQGVCRLFGIHKNTLREWFRQGLLTTDKHRPYIIHGNDLKVFLEGRQKSRRKKCELDEFYCFRCRFPRRVMGNLIDLERRNEKTIMLTGFCASCEASVHKLQSIKALSKIFQTFDISKQQQERLVDCLVPSLNCALEKETQI